MHCTGAVGPHEPAVLLTMAEGRVYPRISQRYTCVPTLTVEAVRWPWKVERQRSGPRRLASAEVHADKLSTIFKQQVPK
jgi:hypothetical protein